MLFCAAGMSLFLLFYIGSQRIYREKCAAGMNEPFPSFFSPFPVLSIYARRSRACLTLYNHSYLCLLFDVRKFFFFSSSSCPRKVIRSIDYVIFMKYRLNTPGEAGRV